MWKPIALLLVSNFFMTYAWYGHLKDLKNAPLWTTIIASWSVAFLEYCFQSRHDFFQPAATESLTGNHHHARFRGF
jgi:uncharacterized protein (DUF486 family)